MPTLRALFLAPLLALVAGCVTPNVLSLEGRAIVLDDQTADTPFQGATADDVEVEAYGVHAAVATPVVDVLGGVDFREFEGEDATELTVGARLPVFDLTLLQPYLEANLRYSSELDTGVSEEDYFGWNAGFGTLLDLTETLFLNFRVVYETTDIDGNDVDGLLGTVGVGLRL